MTKTRLEAIVQAHERLNAQLEAISCRHKSKSEGLVWRISYKGIFYAWALGTTKALEMRRLCAVKYRVKSVQSVTMKEATDAYFPQGNPLCEDSSVRRLQRAVGGSGIEYGRKARPTAKTGTRRKARS